MPFNVEYFWVLPLFQSARKNQRVRLQTYCLFLQFAAVDLIHNALMSN